jgi:hypothetical protein
LPAPALDFPNAGDRSEQLFAQLDAIVREANAALYPAKDARMPSEMFRSGFPAYPGHCLQTPDALTYSYGARQHAMRQACARSICTDICAQWARTHLDV